MDDIAVIGIGVRFPGDATSPAKLWDVLEKGESQWSEFPKDRLNIEGYYHPGGDRQGSISFKGAHFIKEDLSTFDASFFSVVAEDAKAIDPQQRLLLEVSYEALENAGIRKEDVAGSATAVYVGSFVKDYEQICLRDPDWQPQYAATGNGIAIMANRISYYFNLHGPSMTVDTGCSGSLVSVHLAAQSLRTGESSLAIAAGAGMILTPNTIMPMTALNFLSPDGKCFTFDSRANGYGRGEGVGVVILKRLSDALRDNDPIRGVIRGSHINQDGRTPGITLPSKEAQVANIRAVYQAANLDFEHTGYVECHGTGTRAGDWRELKAISETLGLARSHNHPIFVGSVKPNIGHLEGAAGVAGLIKGLLMLEHGKIPPHINFINGNPDISFKEWNITVPTTLMDWPASGTRRVSVNCFGFGGTNAHVIVDEAPTRTSSGRLQSTGITKIIRSPEFQDQGHPPSPNWQLYCYSAHDKPGISRVLASHNSFLEELETSHDLDFLNNYAFTLACRRSNLEWKQFTVAQSLDDLRSKLHLFKDEGLRRSSAATCSKICFVFCGQGSQWARMGSELRSYSSFWYSLNTANWYLKTVLGSPYDLIQEILEPEATSRISLPEISQPATTAIQVALVDLFRSFDVKPNYLVGHSSGEIAAAFAYGAISRETAWEIAYYRGLAAGSIPHIAPDLRGAMLAVALSCEEVGIFLQGNGNLVQIACVNSPKSVTLSGDGSAIQTLIATFKETGIYCRLLRVDTAYHSSHMKLVEADYQQALTGLQFCHADESIQMFSSVTGARINAQHLTKEYWVQNMVSTVQYARALQSLMDLPKTERPNIFLELGPSPVLQTPTLEGIGSEPEPIYISTLTSKLNDSEAILRAIGELWSQGCNMNMKTAMSARSPKTIPRCLSNLPSYPWNHSKSYWHESHLSIANRFREFGRRDLIGAPTADSVPFEPRWRGFLRLSENPWIQDHQIQKTIVYPAAGMVSMVLEAATQISAHVSTVEGYEILNMCIDQAMIIPKTAHGLEVALNMKVTDKDNDTFHFSIYSKKLDKAWEKHCNGTLHIKRNITGVKEYHMDFSSHYECAKTQCTSEMRPREMYETLDVMGITYGPLFQNITSLHRSDTHCVGTVRVPDTKSKMPAHFEYPHLLHPSTLDSIFQILFSIRMETRIPKYISKIFVSAAVLSGHGVEFEGYATARPLGVRDVQADITMRQVGNTDASIVIRDFTLAGMDLGLTSSSAFLPNYRNLCTHLIWDEEITSHPESIDQLVRQICHKHGMMSVLQIGGGASAFLAITASSVEHSGQPLPRLSRYTVVNAEGFDISHFVQNTALQNVVENDVLENIQHQYDVVVHWGNNDIINSLGKVKAGGVILKHTPSINGSIDIHPPFVLGLEAKRVAEMCEIFGFQPEVQHPLHFLVNFNNTNQEREVGAVILISDNHSKLQELALILLLELSHDSEIVSSKDVTRQFLESKNVISLLEMDDSKGIFNWKEDDFELFRMICDSSHAVLNVTQGAFAYPTNPKSSPIMGLTRTLRSEDSRKKIGILDIESLDSLTDKRAITSVLSVCNEIFDPSIDFRTVEFEYALLGGKLHIPRLRLLDSLNAIVDPDFHSATTKRRRFGMHLENISTGFDFDVSSRQMGRFIEQNRSELGANEVEVVPAHAILTREDADTLHGKSYNTSIGLDLIGHVRRLGINVEGFQVGDQVAAMAPHQGTLRDAVCLDAGFICLHRPGFVPSMHTAAFYAMVHLETIRNGERILVYEAANPFGLACLDIALASSADVYIMTTGLDSEQYHFFEERGIEGSHILKHDNSSPLELGKFATVINAATNLMELYSLIQVGGTIIQLASHSIEREEICLPQTSATIINVDIRQLLQERPLLMSRLMQSCLSALQDYSSLPVQHFDVSDILDGFSALNATSHVAVDFSPNSLVSVVNQVPVSAFEDFVETEGTYILSGGLGGLGRSISTLLINSGAKHFAYLSRSGGDSVEAALFLNQLLGNGIDARSYTVDICNASDVQSAIEKIVQDMPPICGVFHCAAVIKDAVFDNMSYNDWRTAMDPKTKGPWNLVEALRLIQAKAFHIFLASSSGVIGSRGQANYAAGNAFLDSLAHYCCSIGFPSVSVDLGPILGAGMVAHDEEVLNILRASGFYGIRHDDFLTVVKHAVMMQTLRDTPMPAQVILGIGTGGLVAQNKPADPYWTRTALYSHLALVDMPKADLDSTHDTESIHTLLQHCSDSTAAAGIICQGLCKMLAKSMNMMAEEIDSSQPPNVYGVDSLVAVGVRNWVHGNCGVEVSVFEVMSDATIRELAALVVERR